MGPDRHAARFPGRSENGGHVVTITAAQTDITETGLRPIAVDLYRDIHKAIRSELFALTEEAGGIDPSNHEDRAALAVHARSVSELLISHAHHEDANVQPVLETELPALAERIEADHEALEARIGTLTALADAAVTASEGQRFELHRIYIELAGFTSAYLAHQDVEERVVMPALEGAIGVDAVVGIHLAIVGSIPPDEMARALAVMLPAMNVDDRTELLGGIQASAPAPVFDGVWRLAGSVLRPSDHAAVANRLGLGR